MKKISVLLLLLLLCASTALGQWKKDGKKEEDEAARKSVKGFGAHLLIVEDPQGFIREWLKPETPKIKTASVIRRNETFAALILFAGCRPDEQRVCNSEVEYRIYKPDGSLYVERKGLELWKEEAPPAPNIQLGKALLTLRLRDSDPTGEYKVKAKVYDLNALISFELEAKFSVPAK